MSKFSISSPPLGSEASAYEAAMAIVHDLSDVDGIQFVSEVIEENGNFVVRIVVIIPPEAELTDEQAELVGQFTDLDEKQKEISADFEEAENEEPKDPVAEAVAAQAMSKVQEEDVTNDTTLEPEQLEPNASKEENEIIVGKLDIPEMAPESAPELEATVVATEEVQRQEAASKHETEKLKEMAEKVEKTTEDEPEPEIA